MTSPNKPKGFLLFLFAGLYMCLFLVHSMGFLAPWIPVAWWPLVHILSPVLNFLLPLHLIFFVYFLRKRAWRSFFLSALALGSGIWVLHQDLGLGREALPVITDTQPTLRVASYNVGTFNYDAANIDKVALLLNQERPDVICLQEFRNHQLADGSYALDHLASALGLPHYRFVHLPVHIHGAAVYSRYPISKLDTLYLPSTEINSGILLTLESPLGAIGIGNVHLSSYQVKKTWDEAKGISPKLKALYKQARATLALQQQKVDQILARTADFPNPLVLTGDMNAVPHSRVSYRLRSRFQDSFFAGGQALGWTFPILGPLGLRIDYHYHSEALQVTRSQILRSGISDHYPVVIDYTLTP